METSTLLTGDVPLSEEESRTWAMMVEDGSVIREPIVKRQAEKRAARDEVFSRIHASKGHKYVPFAGSRDTMKEIPNRVKRLLIYRMAGISFKKAGMMSGATWLDLQDARAHSEEFRCALAAQEENSRQLMKAKAQSIMELSQDEDAKVSLAQTQISMRILESLDRGHFGDDVSGEKVADEVKKQLGGGGFVINLIGDAARTAEVVPVKKPGKALVYSDV